MGNIKVRVNDLHTKFKTGFYLTKANILSSLRGKGIDKKAVAMIREFNVIPRNQSAWLTHSASDIDSFMLGLSANKVGLTLKNFKESIFITKESSVPPLLVLTAIEKVLLPGVSMFGNIQFFHPRGHNVNLVISKRFEAPIHMIDKNTFFFHTDYLMGKKASDENAIYNYYDRRYGIGYKLKGLYRHAEDYAKSASERSSTPYRMKTHKVLKHASYVFAAYLEIPVTNIDGQETFLLQFQEGITRSRIKSNIDFLSALYFAVPPMIMLPTISCHDLGKIVEEKESSHPEAGAKMIDTKQFMRRWRLDQIKNVSSKIAHNIVVNSIRHHLIFGSIGLGEYSLMSLYDMFLEKGFDHIIKTGYVNLFIDTLTLLTACDMAGCIDSSAHPSFIPLHRKIENLYTINKLLKNVFSRINKWDNDGKQYLHDVLMKKSEEMAPDRICMYLSGQDGDIDTRTNEGFSYYRNKLLKSLLKMQLSLTEHSRLIKFFTLLQSFPYSGVPVSFVLWGGDQLNVFQDRAHKKNEDVNIKALEFFLQLSKEVDLDSGLLITANFVEETRKHHLHNIKENREYFESFAKMINDGHFPKREIKYEDGKISISICLPKEYVQK